VADEQMTEILRRGDGAETTARALVALALDAGGSDNVTVIVALLRE